ncbi:HNH endonuclease [Demequina mangrovi]|uniref:5-methylcytosine-specific restriction enzyme A n=1 Tax=Demequina mangrovi TaxID=1043493 RepID=A0A1H6Z5Q0_9MICO|nr:HNH endonuclease signature motif containing protein [Demequina mangrovi]SEJ44942.1 5-methylcytosine-specific restriction enzyme A [Demequina mangrovi]
MTFSIARLDAALEALRGFDGRELADLSPEEYRAFAEATSALYRHAGVAASASGAEGLRRASASGAPTPSQTAVHRREVARSLGVDERGAQQLISAGASSRETRYAHVDRAFRDGRIGAASVEILARTLDSLPDRPADREERLVAKAARLSVRELRRACEQAVALVDREALEAKERRHRENRELVVGRDADGMVTLRARLDAASAAPIVAWLDAQVRDAFQRRRDDAVVEASDRRTAPQVRVDALVALAQHGLGCEEPGAGVRTEVVVRLDPEGLESGVGLGSCDSLDGPVSAGTMRMMAVDASIVPAVIGGASVPLDWGRAKRLFSRAQRRALVERDGGCAWCLAPPSWCVVHHVRYWREGGGTDLDNGVLLCTGCHVQLHASEWELEMRAGYPWLIPPASVDPARTPIPGGVRRLDPRCAA